MEDNQKTAVSPEPQKTAVTPQKTAIVQPPVIPQKTSVAPQGTAVAPQKTAAAPQKTAVASQTETAPKAAPAKPLTGANVELLGAGTEADVYLIDKNRVRKVYHPGFKANSKVYKALGQLRGKGVIADIMMAGKDADGNDYEEMPYFALGSVDNYDITGNEVAILALILRAAQSLDAIHSVGIVHKDIKPANILIRNTSTWECAITDFGIADLLTDGKVASSQSRTPIYAAPELYDPKKAKVRLDGRDIFEITAAVDFYALGMTALSLWSGEETFFGQEEAMAVQKVTTGIKVPKDMPPRLAKIAKGLLEPDPSKRWALKQIEDSLGGKYAAVLALNPLADIKLCCDPSAPGYAMTGESLGKFFNDLYIAYYQKDRKLPAQLYICKGIMSSFRNYKGSMLQQFFQSKGDRFKNQEKFIKYCFDWDNKTDQKRPWPQDEKERFQLSMMKMIKGLGHEPYLAVPGSDTVIRTVDEYEALSYNVRKSLVGNGLNGWLACQFQENPNEDLGKNFRYETLSEQYLNELGLADSGNRYVLRFTSARSKARNIYDNQITGVRWAKRKNIIQLILTIVFCLLPLLGLTALSVKGALDTVSIDTSNLPYKSIASISFFVIGGIAWLLEGTLIGGAITGFVGAIILHLIIRFGGAYSLWLLVAVHLTALVFLFIKGGLFGSRSKHFLSEPGLEELLVEPLHYAYGNESSFDSSLNGQFSDYDMNIEKAEVKDRRKKILIFFGIAVALAVADWFIPQIPLNKEFPDNVFQPKVEQVTEEEITEDEVQEVQ